MCANRACTDLWETWESNLPSPPGNDEAEEREKIDVTLRYIVKTILKNTVVFLRIDHLLNNEIGRREDLSVENCLRGVLRAIKNPDIQIILEQSKAIVLSSGIDLAYLIICEERHRKYAKVNNLIYPKTITVFFRYFRTDEYYRNNVGEMPGHGWLMLVSCLQKLEDWIKSKDKGDTKFKEDIQKGIHDGLFRMLLQFNRGYFPKGIKDEKENDDYSVSDYHLINFYNDIYNMKADFGTFEKKWICGKYTTRGVEVDIDPPITKLDRPKISTLGFFEFSFIRKQSNDIIHVASSNNANAEKIVTNGFTQLLGDDKKREGVNFPLARFGEMTVIDPGEIMNYRLIMMQMRRYIDKAKLDAKPLALAVFGPPGAGKSTGIIQVAAAAFCKPVKDLDIVSCNLAQFTSADQLTAKLHDAQDIAQGGKTPIVFLDEFDSIFEEKQFGWFKYLLPLLQDGKYKMGHNEYHLGKAIVILAGGVYSCFGDLNIFCREYDEYRTYMDKRRKDREGEEEFKRKKESLRAVKGPDLISRLRGIIDIKGINQINDDDVYYLFRRAVILRNMLEKHMPDYFSTNQKNTPLYANIERRVLNALLNVKEYRHGTRSMEALIEMSGATSRDYEKFVAAMIPPGEQLDIHVDRNDFWEKFDQSEQQG